MNTNLVITKTIALFSNATVQAIINVDADPDTSRLIAIDRYTLTSLCNKSVSGGNVSVRVPVKYLNTNNILIGIVSDTLTYNAKFVDGVTPEVVIPV